MAPDPPGGASSRSPSMLVVRPTPFCLTQLTQTTEWRFLMETIRGRRSHNLDSDGLMEYTKGYNNILLDIGTGDGRFVACMAERHQENFFIGVDACRENLHTNSQRKLANALFVIANAQALPCELVGLVNHVSINFPWGSLLGGLLNADCS